MASIKFKDVVSFSSQDSVHRVFNLLEQNSQFKKWLCAPEEKSGRLQAEFQLEKASQIGFVDIGNFGCAFVEVQVRRSSWPESRSVTMIPATMMMSPQDSKIGKNKCSVKMFTQNQLTEESVRESWDRVKVLCQQPYKKEAQFGLAFIRLAAVSAVKEDHSPESLGTTMTKLGSTPSNQPTKKKSILAPSWKTNAVFHRQVISTTQKEQNNNSDLKNRLLKMSATSENGSDKEGCLSRSAKLVMAAASGKKSRREFIMSPTRQDTQSSPGLSKKTSPAQVSNGRLLSRGSPGLSKTKSNFESATTENCKYGGRATLGCDRVAGTSGETQKRPAADKSFSVMVKDFLKSVSDEKLKHTTLKAIRKEFEQSIGKKLNAAEKSELKAKAILAVTGGTDNSIDKPSHPYHRQSHPNGITSGKPHSTAKTPTSKYTPKYQSFTTPNRRISTAVAESAYKNTPRHPNFSSPHRPNSNAQSPQTKNTPKYTPGRMTDIESSSSSPSVSNSSQQRHIPKSQRKRPHSPEDSLRQFKSSRRSFGSGKDGDVNAPTLLQGSTIPACKAPLSTSRSIPPWMAATVNHLAGKNGLNLASATGTPTRGRGRGRRTSLPGERKSCDKCNKQFTAAGIARHMAKCKGPKPKRHSTGRGKGAARGSEKIPSYDLETNLPEVVPMTAHPGTSNNGPSQITDSNFGMMTTDLVKCPVCLKDFPVTLIELHASMCGDRDVILFEGGPDMGMGVTANPIWIE